MKENLNLTGNEAIEKLKEMIADIKICLFSTNLSTNYGSSTRPMTALDVDDEGNVFFFSEKDSLKNMEVKKDKYVQLVFSDTTQNNFLIANGEAEIIIDKNKIDQLWTPFCKIWFKEGKNDSSISIIKVKTKMAYYWESEGNKMVNFFKLAASVITGNNVLESNQGLIKP